MITLHPTLTAIQSHVVAGASDTAGIASLRVFPDLHEQDSEGYDKDDTHYVVCDRLLDPETNEHCEFDGEVRISDDGAWRCPSCKAMMYEAEMDTRKGGERDV